MASLLPTTASSRMALYKIVVRDYLGRPPDPAGQHNFSRRCFDEPTPRPSKFTRHAKYKASRSLSFDPAKAHAPKTFVDTKEAPFWYSLESREERKKYDYDLITQKQKAVLPEKLLIQLQNSLKSMYANRVTQMSFSNLDLGDYGLYAVLKALQKNTSLTYVDLSNTQMGDDSLKRLSVALLQNQTLRGVSLGGACSQESHKHNRIGDAGAIHFFRHLNDPSNRLAHVTLESDRITDKSTWALCKALEGENCTRLSTLALRGPHIRDMLRLSAAILKSPCMLTALDLSKCSLGDQGGVVLGNMLLKNRTISRLVLRYAKMGERGMMAIADALAKVGKSGVLACLDLQGNSFSDNMVISMCGALRSQIPLVRLNIRATGWLKGIGHAGGSALASTLETGTIRSLKLLDLRGHEVGEGVELRLWHSSATVVVLTGEH